MAVAKIIDGGLVFAIIAVPRIPARRGPGLVIPFPERRTVPEAKADSIEISGETPTARWQRLMVAAQTGDQRCYVTLLQEAAKFVRVIARRYHADAGAIEDVVQETLLSVHRIRHTYEPGRPVEPWIAAIAKARAIDALRARKRRASVEHEISPEAMEGVADGARHADDKLSAQADIATALESLSPGQRAAVRLLKIEELSLSEAARVSGQSVPALKSLLHRAMLSLRASLKGGRDG
ncbi:MAG: sigma-70 family RNA polymerase sigma factor [Micropepsaceae bacterium]